MLAPIDRTITVVLNASDMPEFVDTSVQSNASEFGATVRTTMSDYLPPPAEEPSTKIAFTVRLTTEQNAELDLVADTWNAIDKKLGHKRRRKWKASSVVAVFISNGLDRFWEKASEGRPVSREDRETFIKSAVARALETSKKK